MNDYDWRENERLHIMTCADVEALIGPPQISLKVWSAALHGISGHVWRGSLRIGDFVKDHLKEQP